MFRIFYCFLLLLSCSASAQQKDTAFICGINEVQPDFPGGFIALKKYIDSSIRYPDSAREAGASGRVILTFTIRKDGSITDVKVLRDLIGYGCAEEAKRVMLAMPAWIPGKKDGVPVDAYYTIPVDFKLYD